MLSIPIPSHWFPCVEHMIAGLAVFKVFKCDIGIIFSILCLELTCLRFIRPFKILKRVGEVAYVLELPEEMKGILNTFHVSYLRKCLANETSVVTLGDIEIDPDLTSQEEPKAIMGRKVRMLRNKEIPLVKVQ